MRFLLLLSVLVPLGLTFYAWRLTSGNVHQQALAEFEALARENEHALLHRLDSYNDALLSGTGFFLGSDDVQWHEWQTYVEAIKLRQSFPGLSGLGFITPVQDAAQFTKAMHSNGAPDFTIHPATTGLPLYIVKYAEPLRYNMQGIGLNIAFDAARRTAAELARDSGESVITPRIDLMQDEEHAPGFLLLHPVYRKGMPTQDTAERRAALMGWVFAPFRCQNFLHGLTRSEGTLLQMRIYEGHAEDPAHLIYESGDASDMHGQPPIFAMHKQLTVMQQPWLVVWQSTRAFEHAEKSDSPLFILAGGGTFTVVFGLFLLMVAIRRTEMVQWMAEDRKFIFPLAVFLLGVVGSVELYQALHRREVEYARTIVQEEAQKIEQLIEFQTRDKLLALTRMGQRWNAAHGTPKDQWNADASHYTEQLEGLKALEWVGPDYRVHWVEPMLGNEKAIGLDVRFDAARAKALDGAANRHSLTITDPLDLVQGYRAFLAYAPLQIDDKFDGFMVGIFKVEDFLGSLLTNETNGRYAIYIESNGKELFHSASENGVLMPGWIIEKKLSIYDKDWTISIVPARAFIQSQMTALPRMVLGGGLLIALLLALVARYVLLARIRSHYLAESNRLNVAVLSSAAYMVVATDKTGKVIVFNTAAEEALERSKDEVIGHITPLLWHDPVELAYRAAELSRQLDMPIAPGLEVFTILPQRDGRETREWTLIRADGSRFPASTIVTPLRTKAGTITGFLWVIEDITERKRQQQELETSEQTFRAAMEHASIGMALVDLSGRWRKVNPALCDLFGYSEQQLLALDFQAITHPEDLERDLSYVRQTLAGTINSYQIEKRYFHKSGRIIWALLNVSLVRDAQGAPKYFISQIQDISERKEMDRMKSEFISIVSHELRTPLTSIHGSLGLLVGTLRDGLSGQAQRLVDIAHKNSERLIVLINDILDIDKIASGKMRFDMQPENLAVLMAQAVEANLSYAEKFSVTFALQPVQADYQILTDASRFTQVMTNFLSNAAKFSPAGGTVEISVQRLGRQVRVIVSDHGPGISVEFRPRVFGKFSQADASVTRSKGGTGLGLHISKQMVEQMGGKIGFDSAPGQGSSFWMQFPLLHTVALENDSPLAQLEPRLPNILHVDDNLLTHHMLAAQFKGKATLVHASSLAQAEQMLTQAHFQLVILDIDLPDGMGLSLPESATGTPVMILSDHEMPVEIRQQVAASIVKSSLSEQETIAAILALLKPVRGE